VVKWRSRDIQLRCEEPFVSNGVFIEIFGVVCRGGHGWEDWDVVQVQRFQWGQENPIFTGGHLLGRGGDGVVWHYGVHERV